MFGGLLYCFRAIKQIQKDNKKIIRFPLTALSGAGNREMTDFQNDNLNEDLDLTEEEKQKKIEELREIIKNAQDTISSATQLLSALQGETPEQMPIEDTQEKKEDGQVVYGHFDGQVMVGDDGRQYPVPANYASKSKLVEGDKLKLNITPDNKFVYKQVGPVQRNYLIGIVAKDDKGNFVVKTPQKTYKVLLAAATYFKLEPGDEVTLVVPRDVDSIWGAIENVLQKGAETPEIVSSERKTLDNSFSQSEKDGGQPVKNKTNEEKEKEKEDKEESENKYVSGSPVLVEDSEVEVEPGNEQTSFDEGRAGKSAILDEWDSDVEKLKKEIGIVANE